MWQFWLIISGICLIIESFTLGFFVFWFSIGALLALIVSLFTTNIVIQSVVFVVSSTILLLLTKPLIKKFVKTPKTKPTNVYSIIGKGARHKNVQTTIAGPESAAHKSVKGRQICPL